jgi:hypothetical protein
MNTGTPTGKEYPCATLLDMVRIPPERFAAFHAELPRLIEMTRPILEACDKSAGQLELIARQLIWVDDGVNDGSKDERTIEFAAK